MSNFCEECGGPMSVVQKEGEKKLECDICGHTQETSEEENGGIRSAPAVEEAEAAKRSSEIVYEGEVETNRTTVERECPECGHVGAYKREVTTTFAKSESKTMFTCTECGYSWEG